MHFTYYYFISTTYEISFHYYVHTYFIWQILYINLTIYFLHGKS